LITPRPAALRGRTRLGWLDSFHSFSFNQYLDPEQMGFRSLRVVNEDFVVAGAGFGTHGHRDMEILSYVLEGALEHRDSTGGGGVIRPGEIQFMRAGSGVTHSERNASDSEPVHFLQIWILPDAHGLSPEYGHRPFERAAAEAGWVLLASRDGRDESLRLAQDADLHLTRLARGTARAFDPAPGRHVWVQLARGTLSLNGQPLTAGDGARISEERRIELVAASDAELLLFDLA
jgi:redox-sensitive bicupin YhaK (pirin superfamily)